MPVTSTPTTPSSPRSTFETMAQEKQNDIDIPLTREQLHQLNNEQLVMIIMASSVLLQSRLNMPSINEVDKVLATYEALVKREGKDYASTVGLTPQLDGLMEKIELVAEKEKPEGDLDYVLDFGSGAIYENLGGKGKGGRKIGRTDLRDSQESLRSVGSNGSEAETYLSRFYGSQGADGILVGAEGGSERKAAEERHIRKKLQDL
ncbi:hypothetical protein E2P81_ATG01197 [Venturia nashicola]|nr:hypothetical protein E2P81_ATG01197 [Venturia nashicola]